MENPYDFRKRLDVVHLPGKRDPGAQPQDSETVLNSTWQIIDESGESLYALADLLEFLRISMDLDLELEQSGSPAGVIRLKSGFKGPSRSYRYSCSEKEIVIDGADSRGVLAGVFHLQDLMKLREAPFLKKCPAKESIPLFPLRMVHSGYGIDLFPDSQLAQIAHAGFTAILLFAGGVNITKSGETLDFHELCIRAGGYGLDVYLYNYIHFNKHPDEPGAEAYYEEQWGSFFKACPLVKGIVLVGESCQFPSRDPHLAEYGYSKKHHLTAIKPTSGWWPCCDYPDLLHMLIKTMKRYNPEAELIYWTYNNAAAPEKDRLELIRKLPEGITLEVTFETFENIELNGVTETIVDYTLGFVGPSHVFRGEAAVAAERGMKLYTMSDTAGLTWDVGVIPYQPVPQQWAARMEALVEAQERWNLSGLMENHHFGWWPSVITDYARLRFRSDAEAPETILRRLAVRDFSDQTAEQVLGIWKLWSEATALFPTPIEDQYGASRVGPSYPFLFHPKIRRTLANEHLNIPELEPSSNGNRIIFPRYAPIEDETGISPGIIRFKAECQVLEKIIALWDDGIGKMEAVIARIPERKRPEARRMLGIAKFTRNTQRTVLHAKNWWLTNVRLLPEDNPEKVFALLDRLKAIIALEKTNVLDTVPLTEADSRLGWEPTMGYMTDKAHLIWKMKQLENLEAYDLEVYRKMFQARFTLGAACR